MRISDLLRKVADLVDQTETNDSQAELTPVQADNVDNTDSATMISPLQQKHELLKKVSGVDNNTEKFDNFKTDDGSAENAPDPEDELALLQTMAGISGCTKEENNNVSKRDAALALHFVSDDHTSD